MAEEYYAYDIPTANVTSSKHWQALTHDNNDQLARDLNDLKRSFQENLTNTGVAVTTEDVAYWSCLLGYCEALTTDKVEINRYNPFPVPLSALRRLVTTKFVPNVNIDTTTTTNHHRKAAQSISNWVWDSVKKTQKRDELHANSVYVVLQPKVAEKAIDCFGAALCTVLGLKMNNMDSILTLSEDHAYESHSMDDDENDENGSYCTCEVAIPGSTKLQRSKRGQEISFPSTTTTTTTTPQTSWLYMGMAPVYCKTNVDMLVNVVSNLSTHIVTKGEVETNSRPLLEIRREFLKVLYKSGHLEKHPMALFTLAGTLDHFEQRQEQEQEGIPTVEELYRDAIRSSKTYYQDKQVYPYCQLAFYLKSVGQEDPNKLIESVSVFVEEARVVTSYPYDQGDSSLLIKELTEAATCIYNDILHDGDGEVRTIETGNNGLMDLARNVFLFYDHLLAWEEQAQQEFLAILQSHHPSGFVKCMSVIEHDVRQRILLLLDITFRSRRMQGPLKEALSRPKLPSLENALTMVLDGNGRRSRKRRGS